MTTINAWQVVATHGRDQKKSRCCMVHGSRKQCQCSAKHEVATRALADDLTPRPKIFSVLCMVSRPIKGLHASRQPFIQGWLWACWQFGWSYKILCFPHFNQHVYTSSWIPKAISHKTWGVHYSKSWPYTGNWAKVVGGHSFAGGCSFAILQYPANQHTYQSCKLTHDCITFIQRIQWPVN